MKSTKQGFTLIELLVVIAIIGILSGIAIFGLSDARKKGQDAAVIAAIGQIPTNAAIFYDNGNTYASLEAATNIAAALADADENNGAGGTYAYGTASAFVAAADLNTEGATAGTDDVYCVDSTGFTGKIDTLPSGTDSACN